MGMVITYTRGKFAALAGHICEREDGQTLVEYALIIFLIAVAAIAALKFMSGGINGIFSKVANDV
jgi:Flp pilus assembly pilin Flp